MCSIFRLKLVKLWISVCVHVCVRERVIFFRREKDKMTSVGGGELVFVTCGVSAAIVVNMLNTCNYIYSNINNFA